MNNIVINIVQFGGIGSLIFTGYVSIMAYTGMISETRNKEGNFKKKLSWKALTGIILLISLLFGLLYLGNIRFIEMNEGDTSFIFLWMNSFGIFFFIHLYDLIVLDYLIVVKWHPKFLKLPDTDYYRSFKPHFIAFVKGVPIGIGVSLIISLMMCEV